MWPLTTQQRAISSATSLWFFQVALFCDSLFFTLWFCLVGVISTFSFIPKSRYFNETFDHPLAKLTCAIVIYSAYNESKYALGMIALAIILFILQKNDEKRLFVLYLLFRFFAYIAITILMKAPDNLNSWRSYTQYWTACIILILLDEMLFYRRFSKRKKFITCYLVCSTAIFLQLQI